MAKACAQRELEFTQRIIGFAAEGPILKVGVAGAALRVVTDNQRPRQSIGQGAPISGIGCGNLQEIDLAASAAWPPRDERQATVGLVRRVRGAQLYAEPLR